MARIALPAATTSPILLDTVLLLVIRGGYFLLSRRFLLATLSPTLRDISKPELETLEDSASRGSRLVSSNGDVDSYLLPSTSGPSRTQGGLSPNHNLSEADPDSELESSRPSSPSPSPALLPLHNSPESIELGSLKPGSSHKSKKVVVLNHGGRTDQGRTARKTTRGLGGVAR